MFKKKKKEKKKKIYHFTSALFSKDMLRIVKGFALWILFDCLRKSFYIRWSAGRSPRIHEVNPSRHLSITYELHYIYLKAIVMLIGFPII